MTRMHVSDVPVFLRVWKPNGLWNGSVLSSSLGMPVKLLWNRFGTDVHYIKLYTLQYAILIIAAEVDTICDELTKLVHYNWCTKSRGNWEIWIVEW